MTGKVYAVRSRELIDERQGDVQALVDWFNTEFGEGYICEIIDQGLVIFELAFGMG